MKEINAIIKMRYIKQDFYKFDYSYVRFIYEMWNIYCRLTRKVNDIKLQELDLMNRLLKISGLQVFLNVLFFYYDMQE